MKRIFVFSSVFIVAFAITLGAVAFTTSKAEAKDCLFFLPCDPDDIYCTSTPCDPPGTCYPNRGAIFYCAPDWITEHCSGDYYWPVPCSNPI